MRNALTSSNLLVAEALPIGGVTPFTTIDFPGRLAAVFYTQGCPWRCRYCQNAPLWEFEKESPAVSWEALEDFLGKRKKLLDGVVFSGGEPTAHATLGAAMEKVRGMGFGVALHTAGIFPERLRQVLGLGLCDWVGMDVKAPFAQYEKITGRAASGALVRDSVRILIESGVSHEFRTTVHPNLLSEAELVELGEELASLGAKHFAVQEFQPRGCCDETLASASRRIPFLADSTIDELSRLFPSFIIRSS